MNVGTLNHWRKPAGQIAKRETHHQRDHKAEDDCVPARRSHLREFSANQATIQPAKRGACADGQIDLARNDHGGHAEGNDSEHGHRSQHVENVACRAKSRRHDDEEQHERRKDDLHGVGLEDTERICPVRRLRWSG